MKSRRVVNLTFHNSSKKTFEEDSATHFIDSFCQALALQMAANGPLILLNDAVRLSLNIQISHQTHMKRIKTLWRTDDQM